MLSQLIEKVEKLIAKDRVRLVDLKDPTTSPSLAVLGRRHSGDDVPGQPHPDPKDLLQARLASLTSALQTLKTIKLH